MKKKLMATLVLGVLSTSYVVKELQTPNRTPASENYSYQFKETYDGTLGFIKAREKEVDEIKNRVKKILKDDDVSVERKIVALESSKNFANDIVKAMKRALKISSKTLKDPVQNALEKKVRAIKKKIEKLDIESKISQLKKKEEEKKTKITTTTDNDKDVIVCNSKNYNSQLDRLAHQIDQAIKGNSDIISQIVALLNPSPPVMAPQFYQYSRQMSAYNLWSFNPLSFSAMSRMMYFSESITRAQIIPESWKVRNYRTPGQITRPRGFNFDPLVDTGEITTDPGTAAIIPKIKRVVLKPEDIVSFDIIK